MVCGDSLIYTHHSHCGGGGAGRDGAWARKRTFCGCAGLAPNWPQHNRPPGSENSTATDTTVLLACSRGPPGGGSKLRHGCTLTPSLDAQPTGSCSPALHDSLHSLTLASPALSNVLVAMHPRHVIGRTGSNAPAQHPAVSVTLLHTAQRT